MDCLQKISYSISKSLSRASRAFFAAAVSPQESFPPDLFAAPNPNPNPPELSWIQPHLDQNEAKDAQGRLISAIFWTKFLTRL